jgi:hypothetical protein
MIHRKNTNLQTLISLVVIYFCFLSTLSGQNNNASGAGKIPKKLSLKQDTLTELKKRNVIAAEPDTNFTWQKYSAFLQKISDTSKYIVLPLNEFRKTFSNGKIVIGLRHDVDNDLNVAYKFSQIESNLGFRSTYFILHTAPYYLLNPNNMSVHTDKIIPVLKEMQNEKNFEIGWHNDLVTLQVIYNIDPVVFLHSELKWLRSNGINIFGTAAHGSNYCKTYHYMNFYFFEECTFPVVPNRENNLAVPKDGKSITLIKGKLSDFDLQYEAYFLNNNKAFSDAVITNGIRWNIGMLDLSQLQPGDRVIVLLHPIHWHKPSEHANIESFSFPGQKSSAIDSINHIVTVEMPAGTNKSSLIATFSLSPGAYAKVDGKRQVNRNSVNNFDHPLVYRIYAENRDVYKDWTILVHNVRNLANFLAFNVQGQIGESNIDTLNNIIFAEIKNSDSIKSLRPSFILSENSHAWIGQQEQISHMNYRDFSNPVIYNVVSKDNQIIKNWKVIVMQIKPSTKSENSGLPELQIYPNPTEGNTYLHFVGVKTSPTFLDIFNTRGEKVFTEKIRKTGDFTIEEDLKKLTAGVYIVRYSESEKSEIIVVKKH